MRFLLRPILKVLAPVLLTAFLAPLLTGCSSDAPDGDGATVTATAPDETDTATGTPTDTASEGPTDTSTALGTDRDPAVEAVCAPYTAMVTAIKDAASGSKDADEIAAEIGPVLKEFAAEVPSLERPSGLPEETWQGVVALANRIAELPDRPTDAEIEAVEDQLSSEEQEAVEDAFSWFQTNCL